MPLQPHRLLAALGTDEAGPTDVDLLARFSTQRDAGAFELLVYRHAPLVLRVCRSVLQDCHAAEDAAQAVFLALARQARAVRGETLSGWLFRASRRVAVRAARRRPPPVADVDLDALPVPPTRPVPDPADVRLLHDELGRLPEAYRAPILLCYFEGLTRAEAAHRLGWPVGTVDGRLARGKERLAVRLARRGVVPALLAVGVEAVPPSFAGAVARAAVAYSAGSTTGLPVAVVRLVNQETRRTAMGKLLKGVGLSLSVGAIVAGLGSAWGRIDPPPVPSPLPSAPLPTPVVRVSVPKAVVERTYFVAPVTTDLQRLLLRGTEASRAVVWVDGSVMARDSPPSAPATDFDAIQTALRNYRVGKAQPVAHLRMMYAKGAEPPLREMGLMSYALEGAASRAGYAAHPMLTTQLHVGFELSNWTAPLRNEKGWDAAESASGDNRVQVYPVRTPLSRLLTNSADALVEVRHGRGRPEELEKSIAAALAALDLPRGRVVDYLFHIRDEDEGDYVVVQSLLRKAIEARGLAFGTLRRPLG